MFSFQPVNVGLLFDERKKQDRLPKVILCMTQFPFHLQSCEMFPALKSSLVSGLAINLICSLAYFVVPPL